MEYCIYTYLKTLAKFEPHNNYRTRLSPIHGKNKSHTKHRTLKSHVLGMVLLRAGQVPHRKDRVPSSKFLEQKGTRSKELGPVQQKELGSSKFLCITPLIYELINHSKISAIVCKFCKDKHKTS